MLFSDAGKAVRFARNDVRPMGREARGVRGMMLEDGQRVISMLVAEETNRSRADRDRKRLRQAHADRRIHAPRPRHQGHDRHPDFRAQRPGGGRVLVTEQPTRSC
jgi:DNA gyrase subunit A